MKKFLPTIAALILGSTISPSISNYTSSNNLDSNWNWENVQINHSIITPALGTHLVQDTKTDTKATAKPWDMFMNCQQIISNGYFALHTYDGAIYLNQIVLNLNQTVSTDVSREWDFTKTNDVWQGWGHQTSIITLTVNAKYDQSEALTSLIIWSCISARTAGSVHEASTTSQVTSLEFIN